MRHPRPLQDPRLKSLLVVLFALGLGACSRGGDASTDDAPEASTESGEESADHAQAEEEEASAAAGATPNAEEPARPPAPTGTTAQASAEAQPVAALDGALPCSGAVSRALLARKIENREPVDTEPPYIANDEQLYVFLELANEVEGSKWRVTWRHPATNHSFNQEIEVGVSPTWRTWLRHRIAPNREGEWFVDVVAPGGCDAATISFEAVGAG